MHSNYQYGNQCIVYHKWMQIAETALQIKTDGGSQTRWGSQSGVAVVHGKFGFLPKSSIFTQPDNTKWGSQSAAAAVHDGKFGWSAPRGALEEYTRCHFSIFTRPSATLPNYSNPFSLRPTLSLLQLKPNWSQLHNNEDWLMLKYILTYYIRIWFLDGDFDSCDWNQVKVWLDSAF